MSHVEPSSGGCRLQRRAHSELRGRCGAGAAVLLLAASARGDWIQTIGIGKRPALLGGAVSAHGGDPTAWYYNPAGAGDLGSALLAADARVLDSRQLAFSDALG